MPLLYEREETKDEIVIRYKYWPLFYLVALGLTICAIIFDQLYPKTLLLAILVVGLLFLWGHREANREINQAMKEGYVQFTGSKYSFSNPLIAIIKKRRQDSGKAF